MMSCWQVKRAQLSFYIFVYYIPDAATCHNVLGTFLGVHAWHVGLPSPQKYGHAVTSLSPTSCSVAYLTFNKHNETKRSIIKWFGSNTNKFLGK